MIGELILCRFVFFGAHGMKDWPVVMVVFGGVVLLLALVFRKRSITIAAVLGYMASFALGYLLHGYRTGIGGGREGSFWSIWMFAYIGFMAMGIIGEILLAKRKTKG